MTGAVCRKGFPEVQAVTNHVMSAMRKARGAPLPLEKAALCVTLDVIGRVGRALELCRGRVVGAWRY